MWDYSFNSTQSDQALRGHWELRVKMHSVLLDGCFIGNMIYPGIEGIFCVISIDLNTLRGFQDRLEGGRGAPATDLLQ